VTGLARVLRGYAQTGLENVALWHERDISHSGAERVVLPDATILLHYMTHVMLRIVRGLEVHAGRMRENLELTHGAVFSQRLLLALIDQGRTRDEAYRIAQDLAGRAWAERTALRGLVEADPRCAGLDADAVFDPGHYTRHAAAIVGRLPA
jgi:adenylosuccinate lyase